MARPAAEFQNLLRALVAAWETGTASTPITTPTRPTRLTLSCHVRLVYASGTWALDLVHAKPFWPWLRRSVHRMDICVEGAPWGQGRVYVNGHLWKRFGHSEAGAWFEQ